MILIKTANYINIIFKAKKWAFSFLQEKMLPLQKKAVPLHRPYEIGA